MRAQRNLRIEPLEERQLLAVGPELLEIDMGGRAISAGDVRHDAFNELLFRFDTDDAIKPTTLGGFQLERAGANGILGDADDVLITPGYVGIGDSSNEVILRFAQDLPDDQYNIHVDGSVTNTRGQRFNGGVDYDLPFTLDQGTQIISVVPQPVVRDPDTGELTQAKDQVVVYFNSNQLDPVAAANPAYYQLSDEMTGALLIPTDAIYSASTNQATLVFADELPNSTFYLRIGSSDEPNDIADGAVDVGTLFQARSIRSTTVRYNWTKTATRFRHRSTTTRPLSRGFRLTTRFWCAMSKSRSTWITSGRQIYVSSWSVPAATEWS